MSLNFYDQGSGLPLVLLHGFCENKSIWSSLLPELAKSNRVIALDLPGFGENKKVEEITIEEAAEQVHQTLKALKIDSCVMIGHSLGGYVSLAFAEKYPQILKGMGLFHSSAFDDNEEKKHSRNKTAEFIKKNGTKVFAESFVEPLFSPKHRKELSDEIQEMKNKVGQCAVDTVVAYTYAMRDRKARIDVLKSLDIPVLYVVGKDDNAVPLEASLNQCSLPKFSVVHFLEHTGHMGMIERPKESLKIIQLFTTYCS